MAGVRTPPEPSFHSPRRSIPRNRSNRAPPLGASACASASKVPDLRHQALAHRRQAAVREHHILAAPLALLERLADILGIHIEQVTNREEREEPARVVTEDPRPGFLAKRRFLLAPSV